eukprot:gene3342-3618_t
MAKPAAGTQPTVTSSNPILFLVVVSGADLDCLEDPKPSGPKYTRDTLRSLLQLLGCKPRLAYKIMLAVFQAVDQAVINARQQRISRKTFQVHPHRNGRVLRERRRCIIVLLCGTSGSGKSTLASILANRLGITTVISTDSIRHMLRSFHSPEGCPLLWASTYEAGNCLQADAKSGKAPATHSERVLCGYKAQCELLAEQLEVLVAGCEGRQQSLICEGMSWGGGVVQ